MESSPGATAFISFSNGASKSSSEYVLSSIINVSFSMKFARIKFPFVTFGLLMIMVSAAGILPGSIPA
ncbi:hypothetical protein [Synechococcus sp. MIT S1220]|uniref:hypothetical protein n=1 Tax=Synechococcus sp. MIT S1220 TaxID=3082549 RepID=UPI0039AE9CC6